MTPCRPKTDFQKLSKSVQSQESASMFTASPHCLASLLLRVYCSCYFARIAPNLSLFLLSIYRFLDLLTVLLDDSNETQPCSPRPRTCSQHEQTVKNGNPAICRCDRTNRSDCNTCKPSAHATITCESIW